MIQKRDSRKGQVTVFIIIGIVLLILLALALYIILYQWENEPELHTDDVADKFKPAQTYVLSCLDEVLMDGIQEIGSTSGFARAKEDHSFLIQWDSTEADGITVTPDYFVPYWWHMNTKNDCMDCDMSVENYASVERMQEELSRYIEQEIDFCINNFSSLTGQGYDFSFSEPPEVEIMILDGRVNAQMTYPIEARQGDDSQMLENFGTKQEVELFEMHKLATEILAEEMQTQFLENMLMNMVALSSGVDMDKLPPIAAVKEGYSSVFWIKSLVRMKIKDLIVSYMPFIRIENTKNGDLAVDSEPDAQGLYDGLMIPNDADYSDYSVNFYFMDWPYYMDVTPSDGELLKGRSIKTDFPTPFLPSVQTNHYEFFYDLSVPIMVEIRDEDAFDNKGYSFIFAMEANVRDNKDMLQWHLGEGTIGEWDYSGVSFGIKKGMPDEIPVEYDNEKDEMITRKITRPKKTLICDPSQWVSGPVKIDVLDSNTLEPVQYAGISFACGEYRKCVVGDTDSNGRFISSFPVCIGGELIIEADGYAAKVKSGIDMQTNRSLEFRIYLDPVKELSAQLYMIPIADLRNYTTTDFLDPVKVESIRDLRRTMNQDQKTILTIQKVQETPNEPKYSQFMLIANQSSSSLELIPGRYKVTAMVIDNRGLYIPEMVKEHDDQKVRYPEINMTPAMIGGVHLNEETGYFQVKANELYQSDNLDFYMFRMIEPRDVEQFGHLSGPEKYSKKARFVVEPEFS